MHELSDPAGVVLEALRVGSTVTVGFVNHGFWKNRLNALFRGRKIRNAVYTTPWHQSQPTNPLAIADFEEFCREKDIRIARRAHLLGDWRTALPRPAEPSRRVRPLRPRAGLTRREARRLQEAYAVAPVHRVEPVRLQVAELPLEGVSPAAHLDHEDTPRFQAPGRLADQPADEVEPIRAPVESEARLAPEFPGEGVDMRRGLVGRVAQDHGVAARRRRVHEVALSRRARAADSRCLPHVTAGDLEGVRREAVEPRPTDASPVVAREEDGEAARARAHVDDAAHLGGVGEPRVRPASGGSRRSSCAG